MEQRWEMGRYSSTFFEIPGNITMKGKTAGILFLCICLVLAFLLLTEKITPVISGSIFAVSLVLCGGLSSGFRRK